VKKRAKIFLKRIRESSLLLLDDFGKAKNTPAFSAFLFEVIDHRHAHNLPTIWTANSRPDELVSGMTPDMGPPLSGRLTECSRIITIK
jgi:DNA replication protein DnaC